jgi:hypothetical protein
MLAHIPDIGAVKEEEAVDTARAKECVDTQDLVKELITNEEQDSAKPSTTNKCLHPATSGATCDVEALKKASPGPADLLLAVCCVGVFAVVCLLLSALRGLS